MKHFLAHTLCLYSSLGYPLFGYDSESGVEQYSYDYAGRMTQQIRISDKHSDKKVMTYTYDNFDNIVLKSSEDEGGNIETISATYNIMGQKTSKPLGKPLGATWGRTFFGSIY